MSTLQTPSHSLLSLPDEILVLIVKQVDLEGQVNLYETCARFRLVLTEKNVLRNPCKLGCSLISTVETLRRPLFCDLANLITELDLKLVHDLTKTKLVPLLKRFTNLRSLDVSHTGIYIEDFPSIDASCPKLIKLSIELNDNPNPSKQLAAMAHMQKLQSLHIVNKIHPNNLDTLFCFIRLIATIPFEKITELKVTSIKAGIFTASFAVLAQERKDVFLATIPCIMRHSQEDNALNGSEWECIGILANTIPKLVMSEKMYEAYQKSPLFHLWDVQKTDAVTVTTCNNFNYYMFHQSVIENEKGFYENCLKKLEKNLMNIACFRKINGVSNQSYSLNSSNSYYLGPCCLEQKEDELAEPIYNIPNKRRSKYKKMKFNIDRHVCSLQKEVRIMLGHECFCRIAHYNHGMFDCTLYFDVESTQMRNVTFLHFKNIGSVEATFFKLLFQKCKQLSVLNLDNDVQTACGFNILNSLSLATSLTNLRLREPRITSLKLFESLSECSTLENVHIVDESLKTEKLENRFLLKFVAKCVRLYCFFLYLHGPSYLSVGKSQMKILKRIAAVLNRKALDVNVIKLEKFRNQPDQFIGYTDVFYLDNVNFRSLYCVNRS